MKQYQIIAYNCRNHKKDVFDEIYDDIYEAMLEMKDKVMDTVGEMDDGFYYLKENIGITVRLHGASGRSRKIGLWCYSGPCEVWKVINYKPITGMKTKPAIKV